MQFHSLCGCIKLCWVSAPHCLYPLISWWTSKLLHHLGCDQRCSIILDRQIPLLKASSPLRKYPGVMWLGLKLVPFPAIGESPYWLPEWLHSCYALPPPGDMRRGGGVQLRVCMWLSAGVLTSGSWVEVACAISRFKVLPSVVCRLQWPRVKALVTEGESPSQTALDMSSAGPLCKRSLHLGLLDI